jgi:hypothetical protein
MPGHVAAECQRPPPKDRKERDARIDRYVERWHEQAITTAEKRRWIEMENKMLEKEMARK